MQGIALRPGGGQPFTAEHGPGHGDQVTPLVAGGDVSTMPMTDTTRFPNAMWPSWTNNNASQGMGPATFLDGAQWKAWNGRLAVGIIGGNRVEILELNASGMAVGNANAGLPAARYRSLEQEPDGNLCVATDSGGPGRWRRTENRLREACVIGSLRRARKRREQSV